MAKVTVEQLRKQLGTQPPDESIRWLNALIYGEPGVGKTLLGGTVEDHIDLMPCLYLDVDGGITTIRHRKRLDVKQVRSMDEVRKYHNVLYESVDWEVEEPALVYKSLIVDTGSELAKLDMRAIMKNTKAVKEGKQDPYVPSQREYLIAGERMKEIVRSFRDLPCHFFMFCHSGDSKDNHNRNTFFPQFSGKLRHEIAGFFDIVGYMWASVEKGDTERTLQVTKTPTVSAKDRTNALGGAVVNPTLPDIWDAILAKQNGKVPEDTTKKKEKE